MLGYQHWDLCVIFVVYNADFRKQFDVGIISSNNFNAQFNNNMYVTLQSSTCFGP